MNNIDIETLKKERDALKCLIRCADLYFECKKLISKYKSTAAKVISGEDKKQLEQIKFELTKKAQELKQLVEKTKVLFAYFNFRDLIDKLDQIKADYADVCKKIEEAMQNSFPVEIDDSPIEMPSELPRKLFLGVSNLKPIELDLANSGSVIIEHKLFDFDEIVTRFVSAFIIKLYKVFPLNSLRIMLVDPERKYKKNYSFLNYLSKAKNCFEYFDNYDALLERLDEESKMMMPKFSYARPDFYSLYKDDRSNQMKFVLCLSGMKKKFLGSYDGKDALLLELFNNTGLFFKCGVRCLCLYDNLDEANSAYQQPDTKIDRVKDYCERRFSYADDKFVFNGQAARLLTIVHSNLDEYIEEFSKQYVELATTSSRQTLSYEDVGFGKYRGSADEPYISIPVGKNGDEIVNLTFNCASTDSNLNRNIGYFVSGTTGSGKSSLIHSFIVNGCMKYSPDELEFWLIDFKDNAMASRYIGSKVPHITRIAKNSSPEDLLTMLNELIQIMKTRINHFSEVGNVENAVFESLSFYNEFVLARNDNKYKIMPRIVFIIDEMQEVFSNPDTDPELKKYIKDLIAILVNKGRSSGIHLFIVTQAGEENKIGELKQFVDQAVGQILFEQTVPSGFYRNIVSERRDTVVRLETGHFVLCMNEDSIIEARSAYVDVKNIENLRKYFNLIIERYPKDSCQLEIGDSTPLTLSSKSKIHRKSFGELVKSNKSTSAFIIGENFITLQNETMKFAADKNQNAYLVGQNNLVSQSILSSLFLQAAASKKEVYAIDNDKRREFAYSNLVRSCDLQNVTKPTIDELCRVLYRKLLLREKKKQESDDFDDVEFEPIYVFINAIDEIGDQKLNQIVDFSVKPEIKQPSVKPSSPVSSSGLLSDVEEELEGIPQESDQSLLDFFNEDEQVDSESSFEEIDPNTDMSLEDIINIFDDDQKALRKSIKDDEQYFNEQFNKTSTEVVIEETVEEQIVTEEAPTNDEEEIKIDSNLEVREILQRLIEDGCKVSIFFIVTLYEPIFSKMYDLIMDSTNSVFYNAINASNFSFGDQGLAKDTLRFIDKHEINDSVAFSRIDRHGHKFRPILYYESDFESIIRFLNKGE